MGIVVLGDESTVLGLSLVGIGGAQPDGADEALAALHDLLERDDVEVVLVTESLAGEMREEVDRLKMESLRPVVVEIPSGAEAEQATSLRDLVAAAIGIRLGSPGGGE